MTMEILPYPEVKALENKPKRLIVFIHGLGSDGNDLISLVPLMQDDLPDCHFISPHGVEPFDNRPFGRQWFSMNNQTPQVIEKIIARNSAALYSIIEQKQSELNLTNKDTILIGFSQGTMIGIYLNLMQTEPFASVIGFSGRLIAPGECTNKTTPICLIHGELDDVININEMYNLEQYLSSHNIKHKTYKIPNLTHSINNFGINKAIDFINTDSA
jgi:phospholipase/carboxylesterase